MAGVPQDLMFEVLKAVEQLAQLDGKKDELRPEMPASRISQNGICQEITRVFQKISAVDAGLLRHEGRWDRNDGRLELSDARTS